MAAYRLTVYRLDAAGELHEQVVEQADEELRQEEASAAASPTDDAQERVDANAWWAKQLGAALKA